jgi:hypothetical protein
VLYIASVTQQRDHDAARTYISLEHTCEAFVDRRRTLCPVKINREGIRRMSQELEREFAKHPVRVPIQADPQGPAWPLPSATTVNNYHGPVVTVNGDGTQLAWNNANVHQSHERVEQVAPGYEHLAQIITDLLANVDRLSLPEADVEDLRSNADAVLQQVTTEDPDQGIIRRAVTMIKGLLAPVGVGIGDAVNDQSAEMAGEVIDAIGRALPF